MLSRMGFDIIYRDGYGNITSSRRMLCELCYWFESQFFFFFLNYINKTNKRKTVINHPRRTLIKKKKKKKEEEVERKTHYKTL